MWGWLIELIGLIKLIMSIGRLVNLLIELLGRVGVANFGTTDVRGALRQLTTGGAVYFIVCWALFNYFQFYQ